jgi:hypothetical protein
MCMLSLHDTLQAPLESAQENEEAPKSCRNVRVYFREVHEATRRNEFATHKRSRRLVCETRERTKRHRQ